MLACRNPVPVILLFSLFFNF